MDQKKLKCGCWLLVACLPVVALAADKSFAVADGSWNEDANWSPAGVPAVGDTATIPSGRTCRVGTEVTTALVQTTVAAGGELLVEGGALATSDNSTVKKSLTVNGRFAMTAGSVAVHDLTIAATGRAAFPGGTLTVHNNMYNNAATTETTGLHVGQDVVLAKGYWNFNATGGVIEGLNRSLTEIRVETSSKGRGSLTITNANLIVDTLGIAYHTSSRENVTGRVDVVNSDMAVKALKISDSRVTKANRREVFVGTDGTLSLLNSQSWSQGTDESLFVQIGGADVENARLVVTNTSNQMKSITVAANSTLGIGPGAEVSASLYAKAGGRILGTGGVIRSEKIGSANVDTADKAVLSFKDMTVYTTHLICGGSTVDSSNKATDTVITPTEMEFVNTALKCATTYCYVHVGAKATANTARLLFDGCEMDPANGTNYKWYMRNFGTDTAEVVVKGPNNKLYFQQIEGNAFKLEYVFDGGISPINLERTGHPEAVGPRGNLYLTLPEGAALLGTASFDILKSAQAMDLAQVDFASTPWSRGDSPWTGALANGGKSYRVTLDPTATAAPGSGAQTLETPKTAGALSIPVGATDGLETLEVCLSVVGGEDVVYTFPASAVTPNATNYFVWDFDDAKPVSSVRVTAKSTAEKFYLHFL